MDRQSIRVLLIEDDPDDALLIREMLSESRASGSGRPAFTIKWAKRQSEGLELLASGETDIVLLDLNLPDSRGLDTLAPFGAQATEVPVVVLTGLADELTGVQAVRQGAQDYLVKGQLDSRSLSRSLHHALERHHMLVQLGQYTKALEESETQFRRLIEVNTDAMVLVDKSGKARYVNPAAEALFGHSRAQMVGEPFGYDVRTEEPVELEVVRATDERSVAEMIVTEALWQQEAMHLAVLRDITERKQMEEAERELLHMKEDFVACVSHELRTPVAAIKGFVDLLLSGRVPDPEIQEEFLGRVSSEADRLSKLVGDLLDMSRMEAGHVLLELERTDLSELVRDSLNSLETLAQNKQIELQTELPQAPVTVLADQQRIRQVLVNLLGNAIKFSGPGKSVVVSAARVNGSVSVSVKDEGPGIPEEAIPRLFDKFYRVRGPSGGPSNGTGLGLFITKQIISAHGGQIDVRSEVGSGSEFFFTLPASGGPRSVLETRES